MIKNQTQIEYKINGKRLEISVVGEIDHHSCAKLRSEADELIKNNKIGRETTCGADFCSICVLHIISCGSVKRNPCVI